MKARLYQKYISEVLPALKEKRKYTNIHQVPRLEKIVVNMGVSASLEKGAVDDAAKDLSMLTGRCTSSAKMSAISSTPKRGCPGRKESV